MSVFRLAVALTLVAALCLGACGGLSHIDPKVAEDVSWRRLRSARPLLTKAQAPPGAPARPAVTAATTPPPAVKAKPVALIAVFDIETKGTTIPPDVLDRMTVYLVAQLTATQRFQVIPRDQLKKRLRAQKRDSRKRCYDRACQIEIGRELAAQKTLATKLLRLGSKCLLTASVYDLRRAVADQAASVKGACSEDGIVNSIEALTKRLLEAK